MLCRITDHGADDMVRVAERQALADQIVSQIGGRRKPLGGKGRRVGDALGGKPGAGEGGEGGEGGQDSPRASREGRC